MPASATSFDVLISGGRVVDGSGNPWFYGDVGIVGDRIAAIGRLGHAQAGTRLDAAGKVVAPGFIDTHVHGDLALLMDPLHEPAIRQGVTTYILGQDGVAMAPASPETFTYMCRYTAGFSGGHEWLTHHADGPRWQSLAEYLDVLDGASALNAACLVPNGNLRMDVMGLETRPPTADELGRMARLFREALEQGAVGLSTGLDYIPSRYAEVEELAALCREMSSCDGVYVTHMRRYDPAGVHESMDEVYRIGREGGVPVHISHFNSRADLALPKIDEGRRQGVDVTYDLYCYLHGSTILAMIALPPWVQEGGLEPTLARLADPAARSQLQSWFEAPRMPLDNVRLSYITAPEYRALEGRTLAEAAQQTQGGDGPAQVGAFVCDLLVASRMVVGCVQPHRQRTQADVDALMRHPAMMGGSDGIYTGGHPHPRGCGCYARYLGHHVREARTWTLEEAVQRLAAHAARRYQLRDRGVLRTGAYADVIVFDPDTVADRATFEEGKLLATGMEHVLVNGQLVLKAGQRTPALPGRALRRGS